MRDFLFQYYMNANDGITQENKTLSEEALKESISDLTGTVKTVLSLCRIAKNEGLIALEEAADKLDEEKETYLKNLIKMIINGNAPEQVEDAGIHCYIKKRYHQQNSGYEAMRHYLYLQGALAIQAGENESMLEDRLLSILPDPCRKVYKDEKEEELRKRFPDGRVQIVEQYLTGEIAANAWDPEFVTMKFADDVFQTINDEAMIRVLRATEMETLGVAMKGFSGVTRKKVFNCMVKDSAIQLAMLMNAMDALPFSAIVEAQHKMMITLVCIRMSEADEESQMQILDIIAKIFDVKDTIG